MNKKIASEFAIGVVLLVTITVGSIFWLYSERQTKDFDQVSQLIPMIKQKHEDRAPKKCIPHYYEGKADIQGWMASSDQSNENEIIIQLKSGEEEKLPVKNSELSDNFTVKLIDPTAIVEKSLELATEKKPATITIQGYAEVCNQPPLVSLQQATIAFKKS
jgi:cbb3-type cytochrome oxidase subunit 3